MKIQLDGRAFEDKERAFTYLIEQLDLPAYTGHNLDGLWDVLTEKPASQIKLIHGRYLYRFLGQYGLKLLDVLGDLDQQGYQQVTIHW